MNKKPILDLVIEAIATSEVITLDDMDSIEIRDKWVFNPLEDSVLKGVGLENLHNECDSELYKLILEADKNKHNPTQLIEKIYNNQQASVEAIYQYIMFNKSEVFAFVVASRIKQNPKLLALVLQNLR
jgi:hypothetical protein